MIIAKFILQFIFIFINECLIFKFVLKSYNNKTKLNFKNTLVILAISLLMSINNIYSASEIRLIASFILGILMFFLIDSLNIKRSVFYFSLIMFFGLFIEFLISFSLSFFIVSIKELNYIYQPFIAIASYLFWFGGWHFLIKSSKIKYILNKFEESISRVLKLEVFLVLIFFVIDIVMVKHYRELKNHLFFIGAIVNINLLFGLILLVSKSRIKLKYLEISNIHLKQSIDMYEKVLSEYKLIKHNLISDFLTIRSISSVDAIKVIDLKLKQYDQNYSWINNINKIPDGIKGLICLKINEAENLGIKIILEASNFKCKNIYKSVSPKLYLELCETIDILINNSIEASIGSDNKNIKISISESDNKLYVYLINSFTNEIDVSKIGHKSYSTKSSGRGLGIFYIKKLNNNKINVSFKIINDLFLTKIIVELKK